VSSVTGWPCAGAPTSAASATSEARRQPSAAHSNRLFMIILRSLRL